MLSTENSFQMYCIDRLKVKGWKMIYHVNINQEKWGMAILISDKVDYRAKKITWDREGHYIMLKGSVHQEDSNPKYVYIK